jgi:HD superfamily phosphohydrolase
MHLMQKQLMFLRFSSITISDEEENACARNFLLHDIGHGPSSRNDAVNVFEDAS